MSELPRFAYLHLAIVYFVWGSTFVAMRAVVMGNSGFEPFSVGASRLIVACSVLFAWALFRKIPLKISRRDLLISALSGFFIWVSGNALVMWTEQWVEAGYATLIFSTLPLWTLIFESLLKRRRPSLALVGAFVAAFCGMGILGGAELFSGKNNLLTPTLFLLLSTMLWAAGTHIQKRNPFSCSLFVASAYQQLFGALGCFIMIFILGETMPHPTPVAWIAWGYLVIFGSIIAYTSYVTVVQIFPASIAVTFAYVCPVLTVIFGRILLNESITLNKIVGMLIILGSVHFIFKEQKMLAKRPI